MPLFRIRVPEVEAMYFDGSPASALEIVNWARTVAPHIAVRKRIEYGGWSDTVGHLELEIQGSELPASDGDWVVCLDSRGRRRLEAEPDQSFLQRFEPAE